MRLSPGDRLGPYEVLSVLGTGGMGEVYLARDHRLDRRVAIKARHLGTRTDGAVARVLHEGRAAARLSHPRIASVYDVIEDGDTAYLVMEYVEGRTLRSTLRDGPLPSSRAIGLGVDLCDALGEAHEHGVVHGDIKPENICLTPDGHLKVLDFGIARVAADTSGVTATSPGEAFGAGRFMGTPQYAAPEQFEGESASIRSDVYAAAAVVFEMLTGRPPVQGRDALEIGLRALRADAPRADAIQPSVPPALADALADALHRNPRERPGSAGELAGRLRESRTQTGTGPILTARVAAIPARRRWLPIALAALVVLPLLAWAGWKWRPGSAPGPGAEFAPPVVAILPLDYVGTDQRHAFLGLGIADTLIANLASAPGVVVVSRADSASYAARRNDLRRVARELGADFIVDGSVQTAGDAVRVALTLVRDDASVAWGKSYEGRLDRVFDLYPQLTGGLADALTLRLSGAERSRLARPATVNSAALAEYASAGEKLARADLAGNLALAVAGFRRALDLDPRFALARAGLAEAYSVEFRQTLNPAALERAIPEAEEALRLDPYLVAAHVSLGTAYTEAGRLDEARGAFERAIALQPSNDDALRGLGIALTRAGEHAPAEDAFKRAVALRPGFWSNHMEYGRLLYATGRLDDAAREFKAGIESQPDSPRGYQALGTVYQVQGQLELALDNYRKAHQFSPSVNLSLNLGVVEHWMGRYDAAITAFREAASLAPDDPVPVRNMGDSLLRLGREAEARQAYARALALVEAQLRVNPASASTIALQGVLLAKLGRFTEAAAAVRHAVERAPKDSEVVYQQAVVSALAGRVDEGRRELTRAIDLGFPRGLSDRDEDLAVLRTGRRADVKPRGQQ
jgi:serine/threonine-protein kinase